MNAPIDLNNTNHEFPDDVFGYKFLTHLPLPQHTSSALEYLVDAKGIYARAMRPEIEVLMPVSQHQQSLKGLVTIEPYMKVQPLVPEQLLIEIWQQACYACTDSTNPLEMLFYLMLIDQHWQLIIPNQIRTPMSCTPLEGEGSTQQAAIEIHSHGLMPAFFSSADDQDECFGFRIYGVIGKVRSPDPEMLLRVGLFGHCWLVPISQVFQVSSDSFIVDLLRQQPKQYYSNAQH